ncbi:hypothetical protein [Nannocystis pusilla]|uniref:hypothetical protein n=1 Tax=Nannocystis pusilla TaxID=889268 RepID=UPI003B8293FC
MLISQVGDPPDLRPSPPDVHPFEIDAMALGANKRRQRPRQVRTRASLLLFVAAVAGFIAMLNGMAATGDPAPRRDYAIILE